MSSPKNQGSPPPHCCGGNPVNTGTGNKFQRETDLAGTGAGSLSLTRTYNSGRASYFQQFGGFWLHDYAGKIMVNNAHNHVTYFRNDGKQLGFNLQSGAWTGDADIADVLTEIKDVNSNTIGWKYRIATTDSTESYDAAGHLTSIQTRSGLTQTLVYSDGTNGQTSGNGGFVLDASGNPTTAVLSVGYLLRVTDNFGRLLTFGYDARSRIVKVVDPAGGVFLYAYDAKSNLTSVTYPDGHQRLYEYNEPAQTGGANFPNALTGITDESGARFATYTYESSTARVSQTVHDAGGSNADRFQFSYPVSAAQTVVTDPLGTVRTEGFQLAVGVVKNNAETQPAGSGSGSANRATTYDANGNVASQTDFNGNVTHHTYDLTRDLETSRTEAFGTPQQRTISTQWHPAFTLPAAVAEPLRITSYVYNGDGGASCGLEADGVTLVPGVLCSKTIQPTSDATGAQGFGAAAAGAARTWSYTYNANGSVLTMDGPRTDVLDVTTYTYYANNDADSGKRGNVATIANALGQTTNITAYNAYGQPLTIVDPNGLTTNLAYDARMRLTSRSVGGETTSYGYDAVGQLTLVTLPDSSSLAYTYDAAHRLTAIADNLGNRIDYTLDGMGNRTQEQIHDPANALTQTRSRVYDALNRLFKDIGAQNQTTQYAYDNQGNVTSVTDPLTHVTGNQYDALNRLVIVTDPNLGHTQYAYNGIDQLTSVTDPRNLATTYNYDGLSNLNSQVSPDTGTTQNTYDSAGNLLTQTDAKSQTTTYVYDALNRVISITFQDGSKQNYSYDTGTNGLGRLTSIAELDPAQNQTSLLAYAYDQHGRVTSETRTVAGVAYVTAYQYDSAGRLSGMTYPSGRTVAYTFDALGRISQVSSTPPGGSAQMIANNVAYQPFGGVNGYLLGNGQSATRGFDQDGRIASYNLGATTYALGYDAASRILFINDTGNPPNSNTYGYDNLDRLTSAVLPSTPFAYSYDAVGNRLSKTAGSGTDTYTYASASNQIASISGSSSRSFAFDADGSTTNDGVNQYVYDTRGRMVQSIGALGTTAYQVNALGQRIRKTNAGDDRVFVYDTRGRLIAESTPAGALLREYLYLGDTPVATVDPGGSSTALLFTDGTGTLSADTASHHLTLSATGLPTLSATASSWQVSSFGSWQFTYFSAKDAQNHQLSGEFGSLSGVPQSSYVTLYQPPLRNENYNLSGAVGSDHYSGSDPSSGLSAVMDVDETAKTVTVSAGSSPTATYTIDPSHWSTGTAGSYQTVSFTYSSGDLSVAGGMTRNSTNNFAWLQIVQGQSQYNSFNLTYQGTAPALRTAYIQTDHLNTPRLIEDQNQNPLWRWDQGEPFGNDVPNNNPSGAGAFEFNLRFPGQYFDKETNLNYNMARDYSSEIGRYIYSDPLGLKAGLNTYAYVSSNPLKWIDPTGLFCTQDFVNHYFYGSGQTVDLGGVGLLGAFQSAASVRASVKAFKDKTKSAAEAKARSLCPQCVKGTKSTSFTLDDRDVTDVTNEPCLFSVGNSTFFRSANCSVTANCDNRTFSYGCSLGFKIQDWFRDPIDLGIEIPGATPYRINANWADSVSGSGRF